MNEAGCHRWNHKQGYMAATPELFGDSRLSVIDFQIMPSLPLHMEQPVLVTNVPLAFAVLYFKTFPILTTLLLI